ncbi:MAG TPA: PilZ domain-containing protein [Longimicrobiales bacterium]
MLNPQRAFIRHTVNVPLEIKVVPSAPMQSNQGVNISEGGLAFTVEECIPENTIIELRIPTVTPAFEANARVAWCRAEDGRYLVGVQFLDSNDAFQSRMVQQVCAIENYRQEQTQQGRPLDSQQAASEWIAKFAGRFPSSG